MFRLTAKAVSLFVLTVSLAGVVGAAPADGVSDPIATVNGEPIPREDVVEPLLHANGLNFLLLAVQLKVARQEAAKQGMVIKSEDIQTERTRMMKGLFPDSEPAEYESLVDQLLAKQGISRPQFELIVQTNAALRKVAEPMCVGKVTEDNVKQAFDLKYGATVQIRDIKVASIAAAQTAKQRLAAGERFESVARMSIDAESRGNGGLWPAFAAATPFVSQAIKDQAFGLKEGDVSDIISTEGSYHIIKIEHRNPPSPKVVTLDKATHDYLMSELTEKYVQEYIKVLRARISVEVQQQGILDIRDPILKKQFEDQLAEAKRQQEEQRKNSLPDMIGRLRPSTQPATAPTTPEARERPPATK